jgi:hypothetical protein
VINDTTMNALSDQDARRFLIVSTLWRQNGDGDRLGAWIIVGG